MKSLVHTTDHAAYVSDWDTVARAGLRHMNLDAWAAVRLGTCRFDVAWC